MNWDEKSIDEWPSATPEPTKLIIDTNIVIAALIAQEYSLKLILNKNFLLAAPEFLKTEIGLYKHPILEKSGFPETELDRVLTIIFRSIRLVPEEQYKAFRQKALEISTDPKDWHFVAVALKENCAIWSNDKKLKEQSEIMVYSTHELQTQKNGNE